MFKDRPSISAKYRLGALVKNAVGRRYEAERCRDDLVVGADFGGTDAQMQPGGAAGDGDRVFGSTYSANRRSNSSTNGPMLNCPLLRTFTTISISSLSIAGADIWMSDITLPSELPCGHADHFAPSSMSLMTTAPEPMIAQLPTEIFE